MKLAKCGMWLWLIAGGLALTGTAQELDSLKSALQYAKADTHKVWMFRDIAYWSQGEPDSAIYYSQKGAALAKSLGFQRGQIWSLYQKSIALETSGKFSEALAIYEEMLELARSSDDLLSVTKLYNALGSTYYYAGDFVKAVEFFERGFSMADSLGYSSGVGYALNNMGIIYRLQGRYEKAIDIYNKSLEVKTEAEDSVGIVNSLYNLGLAYSYSGDHEAGLTQLRVAREWLLQLGDLDANLAIIDIGVGTVLFQSGDWKEAGSHLRSGLDQARPGSQEWLEGWALLGAIEVEEGKVEIGLEKIEEALNAARNAGRKRLLLQILKVRAQSGERTGNFIRALESWNEYERLSDSLHSEQRQWALEEMHAKFELREKEATIALQKLSLEKESAKKKLYLISGGLAMLLFLTSAGFVGWIWRQRTRLKGEMILKEDALGRNQLLMREMHHRTKNNLQLLNSLLSLKSRGRLDSGAREVLASSRESVNAIGLLHHHLYRSSEFRNVGLQNFIGDLVDHLRSAANLKERGIRLEHHCEEVDLDIDQAIPLGLVVNELLINSIQHAFPEERGGTIQVRIQAKGRRLKVFVEDDGAGMDVEKDKGTGTHLIHLLASRLGGELQIQSGRAGGTRVECSFTIKARNEVS